ncbi:tetraacyldisaccharide 4'-kinase [Halomonas sp. GXIMD04776]|uniref:tetraacyldisaccharide 4'-kinase n=1 Tax=Halomonas sp. GXIMD04776 TaxID=3415605 RepID=UPI003C9678DA
MSRWVDAWYRGAGWLKVLIPLEWLYKSIVVRRRRAYMSGRKRAQRLPVPVIVVGNITLGGTGKSPLVAWLGRWLSEQGRRPGIVSRGYGGKAPHYPFQVGVEASVDQSGDEPLMLAQQTGLPVVVDPDRPRGAWALVEAGCDIVIADDGLQHLALGRDLELVVVDGQRGFGNARCLPAGPLREPLSRLGEVDAVIVNGEPAKTLPQPGYRMQLRPMHWRHLMDGVCYPIEKPPFSSSVHALAGIGHPSRFFTTLETLGLDIEKHPLADHHHFSAGDLRFDDELPVVMTAKDAVKCRPFAHRNCWVLDVEAHPESAFIDWLQTRLETLQSATREVSNG